MAKVRQREKVVNFRTNALFSRVIPCVERHLKMGEIHWRSDIYLEKRILLFKEECGEKSLKSSKNMIFLTVA